MTWPPNTRCQRDCGERPRNRFTSNGSRSRMARTSCRAEGMREVQSMLAKPRQSPAAMIIRRFAGRCYAARPLRSRNGDPCRLAFMNGADNPIDVLIAGGGFAGLTLAIALCQALGSQFSVTVA